MGIDLVARALITPGDVIADRVVSGHRPRVRGAEAGGRAARPLPVDGSGMVVDALAGSCARERGARGRT